jgi:hypothetical protein
MLTEFFLLLRLEAFVENGQFLALISCAVALVFVTLSCCAAWLARGSTAVPAALWSAAAAFFFALSMLQQADGELDITSMAIHRVVVAALSVCPVVSLLGAKRPQHGVWQLIVGTLAAVLTLPAASAVLIRPGSLPDLHILGRCLLPILVLVGWLNFVGTRRAVAATLIAVGHICLIRPLLPGVRLETTLPQAALDLFAIVFLTCGSGLALVQTVYVLTRRRASSSISDFSSYDNAVFARCVNNCFFPLRETLGAAWTLRLAERFNTLADQRSWPVRLTFHGFQMRDAGKGEEWQPDAARALEALLRRFVSSAWLKRHGWERASLFNQYKMR